MGRNAAIKTYDATAGQPLELCPGSRNRTPAVLALLASPWIVRASQIVRRDTSSTAHRVSERVVVEWDAERRCPSAFTRDEKRYRVDVVIQVWVTERAWWDPRAHVALRYWRVLARGGVYDLAFDRTRRTWRLIGVQD